MKYRIFEEIYFVIQPYISKKVGLIFRRTHCICASKLFTLLIFLHTLCLFFDQNFKAILKMINYEIMNTHFAAKLNLTNIHSAKRKRKKKKGYTCYIVLYSY